MPAGICEKTVTLTEYLTPRTSRKFLKSFFTKQHGTPNQTPRVQFAGFEKAGIMSKLRMHFFIVNYLMTFVCN